MTWRQKMWILVPALPHGRQPRASHAKPPRASGYLTTFNVEFPGGPEMTWHLLPVTLFPSPQISSYQYCVRYINKLVVEVIGKCEWVKIWPGLVNADREINSLISNNTRATYLLGTLGGQKHLKPIKHKTDVSGVFWEPVLASSVLTALVIHLPREWTLLKYYRTCPLFPPRSSFTLGLPAKGQQACLGAGCSSGGRNPSVSWMILGPNAKLWNVVPF